MLPLGKLSPCKLDSPELQSKERELARICGQLERSMHPLSARALARAMAGIHSYYSNLIEGDSTHPITAELAASGRLQEPKGDADRARSLQAQALAGIATSIEARRFVQSHPRDIPLISPRFIRWAHQSFMARLPVEMRLMTDNDGSQVEVIPGQLRERYVAVGHHVSPAHEEIPGLLDALRDMHNMAGASVRSAMLVHHRFLWIHPFLDGNGRVARTLLDGMLMQAGVGGAGLWSMARGLAKNLSGYKAHLAAADRPPSSYTDRGQLSEADGQRFVSFMMDIALDQASFMSERLEVDQLIARLKDFCQQRALVLGRDPRAFAILQHVYLTGPCARGEASALTGLSQRRAGEILRECLHDRLLMSPSAKGAVGAAFPAYALAYLFPSLFPADNPQKDMQQACDGEPAVLASEASQPRQADEVERELQELE